ncbi:hypothetical protein NHX12_008708 [Muraenolepis orangiensis]|uniref:Small nuclear ribonucleoprotein Prp3 C-terminal domain-containing protein n=1 Tax=Muraenolepis orangiensis TaxID=630683 RepID=A0A9Q0DLT6_9TELE|nr:hypothetical protein NHX12_008708 [Muraenolepis orangiensis]
MSLLEWAEPQSDGAGTQSEGAGSRLEWAESQSDGAGTQSEGAGSRLEWAESQLAELELLSSMFPTDSEFEITDQVALAELRASVEGCCHSPPPHPSSPQFLLKQRIDDTCAALTRSQQACLQADLTDHLLVNCRGEVCVLAAVEWLKDHALRYVSHSSSSGGEAAARSPPAGDVFSRLWIYSHHIYNKSKRKNILEWSKELGLSGFSMPGKPGIVCVEGPRGACEEFWVKVLTWKKIAIRHREDVTPGKGRGQGEEEEEGDGGVASMRKFSGFEEVSFDPHGNRGNHMDLGLLYRFLNEHGCCSVFQMYFGVEGR